MPPRRAAAARGGRRPAGVPGPQQVVVGLGTSFFGAPARNCIISRCFATVVSVRSAKCPLWPGRSGPLSSLISGSFASASPPAVASAGAPPPLLQTARRVPPDLPLPQDRGEHGPPRGGGGGIHGFRGASGDVRVLGPGFSPDLRPPRATPPAPLVLPPESLPWLNASLRGPGLPSPPLSARRAMRALLGTVRTLLVRGGPARHLLSSLRAPGSPPQRPAGRARRPRWPVPAKPGRQSGGQGSVGGSDGLWGDCPAFPAHPPALLGLLLLLCSQVALRPRPRDRGGEGDATGRTPADASHAPRPARSRRTRTTMGR